MNKEEKLQAVTDAVMADPWMAKRFEVVQAEDARVGDTLIWTNSSNSVSEMIEIVQSNASKGFGLLPTEASVSGLRYIMEMAPGDVFFCFRLKLTRLERIAEGMEVDPYVSRRGGDSLGREAANSDPGLRDRPTLSDAVDLQSKPELTIFGPDMSGDD